MHKPEKTNLRFLTSLIFGGLALTVLFVRWNQHDVERQARTQSEVPVESHFLREQVAGTSVKSLAQDTVIQPTSVRRIEVAEPTNPAQFSARADLLLSQLPTMKALASLSSEQVHMTPEIVVTAAIRLGAFTDELQQHPEHRGIGLKFYSQCAARVDVIPSIRRVCYKTAQQMYREMYGMKAKFRLDHIVSSDVEN